MAAAGGIKRYKYRALNTRGRQVRGVLAAANELDLHNSLHATGLELLQCSALSDKKSGSSGFLPGKKVGNRELIQLFTHLQQMQGAGVSLLDALSDIRETTDHDRLRDIMSEIHKDVSDGSSLSESMARHPKVFTSLYISLISSGEETGDLTSVYAQLIRYLKWVDDMQRKVKKATRYPMVVTIVVFAVLIIMMAVVVPQIVGFITTEMNTEIPWYTASLIATSDFFVSFWYTFLIVPALLFGAYKVSRHLSDDIAYKYDLMFLNMPKFGGLIRKIDIARFAQTFGALFASGIPVLKGLEASRQTVGNLAITEALVNVQDMVKNGSSLSDAFAASGEFPSLVIRMLKVGEESGNLTHTLDEVAEFYTKDVDEAVEAMITMIEPALTAILGGMIMWIAAGVFGPIYASFENMSELM